jgi:Zn-dependent metalloprotease
MNRNPLHCILPPDILYRFASSDDAATRAAALATLELDHLFRLTRAESAARAGGRQTQPITFARIGGQPQRTIYDQHNATTQTPGTVARSERQPPVPDQAVNQAYDGLGATYTLYWEVFKRDSIDDAGLPLDGIIHYGKDYDNAFWDTHRMIFGDGDGRIFNRFTIAVDVIGHELTHGVTQHTAALAYTQQSGALNESVSDVFGCLVKQYAKRQSTAAADWLIGAGLLAKGIHGAALRSMKAPGTAYDDPVLGKDPQPAHMKDYVQTVADNGGVHTNSGIPNHAFYLVAEKIGGNAWEKPGAIWYSALRDPRLQPTARFQQFASATARAARRLYGPGGAEAKAVEEAWREVGIELGQPPEKI